MDCKTRSVAVVLYEPPALELVPNSRTPASGDSTVKVWPMPSAADETTPDDKALHVAPACGVTAPAVVPVKVGGSSVNCTKVMPDDPELTVTCMHVSLNTGLRTICPVLAPDDVRVIDCAMRYPVIACNDLSVMVPDV